MPASSLRMEHSSMEPLRYVCTIGLKTKMCWLTSADARFIPKNGTLLDGTSSLRVYKRVKNKNVLTHLCWCPPHPWEWNTLLYVCTIGLKTKKSTDSPLLMPASSLRMEHSSMGPKTWNICLISSSLSFFETIPTNSFRSKSEKKSKFFKFFPNNYFT